MKKLILYTVGSLIVVLIVLLSFERVMQYTEDVIEEVVNSDSMESEANEQTPMTITSASFQDNQKIPAQFTCSGEGISPQLSFSDLPEGAKSLALIMDDPDATIGTFVHWVVYNMSPDTLEVAENKKPAGVEGLNSGNKTGYYPPCPPSGEHRYIFTLYALDSMLGMDQAINARGLEQAMEGHILSKTTLTGLYSK